MGKIAFVFPGQGAQYPGMGKELAEASPAAADIFRRADSLRPSTSAQCFEGTAEELQQTKITQPCMFTVEAAAAAALTEAGIHADCVADFSLGEIAALSYALIVDFSTSFGLVCSRGELMQSAAEAADTAMAAVVKLDNGTIEALCAEFEDVYPVNYNCPGQVTVAGLKAQMPAFSAAVKADFGTLPPHRVAVYFGSGIGGLNTITNEVEKLGKRGPGRVSPFCVPMMIPNMAAGMIAIRFHCQGAAMPAVTACVLLQEQMVGGKLPMYTGLNNVKFRSPVRPGDTFETNCRITRAKHPFYFASGEGGSGGALVLAVADRVWMLENAVYSVISPEGCASILWKDAAKAADTAANLKLTAQDALTLSVIERMISEEDLGQPSFYAQIRTLLTAELAQLAQNDRLLQQRYERFRRIGAPIR